MSVYNSFPDIMELHRRINEHISHTQPHMCFKKGLVHIFWKIVQIFHIERNYSFTRRSLKTLNVLLSLSKSGSSLFYSHVMVGSMSGPMSGCFVSTDLL